MFKRIHYHSISFRHALDGIIWVLRTQPNYIIHLFLAVLSVAGGLFFKISYPEWLTISLLITLGLSIETINSTFEATLDAVSRERREDIKNAKDAAAGAMLFFAFGAFTISCVIFVPKILNFLAKGVI